MHKKLAADLTSLAHSILQMKNKDDVSALKAKAHAVYEKLALLVYVEEYINNTPNATISKKDIISKIAAIDEVDILDTKEPDIIVTDTVIETEESIIKNQVDELADTSIDTTLDEDTIIEDNSFSKEVFLTENKDRNEISFTIVEPIEEPFVQESLFTEPEKNENQKIEQPFDELENILFGDAPIKDEASFIEELKTPTVKETESVITNENEIIAKEPLVEEKQDTVTEEEIIPPVIIEETTTTKEDVIPILVENVKPQEITAKKTPVLEEIVPIIEEIKPPVIVEETSITKEEPTFSKESKTPTLEDELADTLSVDVMANLFEKAPVKRTLNDRLLQNTIKIDLNDRIAFVKNLFEGNQEDFNRVISQLNTIKSEKGAKQFILKMVKPDYDWSTKEDYETRLLEIIERKFN